jgi:hypothetical protein
VEPAPLTVPAPLPPPPPDALRIATLNLENHFDSTRDTTHIAEPLPEPAEVALRRGKYATLIGEMVGCPALLAVQEVEKADLLEALAAEVAPACGFTYQVLHRESADARGIDVALLVDPRNVGVRAINLSRACTSISTGIVDEALRCAAGEEPLFSRPPLVARLEIEGEPLLVVVVHFKSKRGDPADTAARRLAQSRHVRELVRQAPGHVLVLGDLNDTPDARPVRALTGDGGLVDLLATLPPEESYTYIYGGIPQRIDGFLADPALAERVAAVRILHANAAFPSAWRLASTGPQRTLRATDHDVPVVDFWLRPPVPATATVPATASPALTPVTPAPTVRAAGPTPAPVATIAPVPSSPDPPPAPPARSWWGAVVGLLALGGALVFFYYRRT